jgi:ubiquinone/menaquinone biosynthesis C-methylase UbiE
VTKAEKAARYWGKLADVYDECQLLAGSTYPPIIEKLKGEFMPHDRLLEVGAGTGILTVQVAPLVAHVTCTDIAPEMLEKAKAKLTGFDHVEYHVETADVLSFEDNSFDVVLCCNVLHQMVDPEVAAGEFHRVLRPGGKLLAITLTMGDMSLGAKVRTGIQYAVRFGIPPASHSFKLSTFSQFIADAGFDIVESELVTQEPFPTAYVSAIKPEAITIVSGLPRSGTSMMMGMLEAGGMQLLVDNIRTADEDNPKGYYEFERVKRIQHDQSWLGDAKGKVVKMISELLKHLPQGYTYKVIFMRRKMEEILASQRQMLIRRGELTDKVSDERMTELYRKHLRRVEDWIDEQPNIEVIYVSYNEILENPVEHARRINQFLGKTLNIENMVSVVEPTLYRQRQQLRKS